MAVLPLNLVADSLGAVGGGKPGRLGGVSGSTQGVRVHVRDGCGLPGCFGGSHRRRSGNLARSGASEEATADLVGNVELATGKSTRSGDGIAGTTVTWSFRLEQPQHTLCAVSPPGRDDPPVGFAQCLRRAHALSFSQAPSSRRRRDLPANYLWRMPVQTISCRQCGALVPDVSGPVHKYVPSGPGCWQTFGQVQADESLRFGYPPAHRIVVDAETPVAIMEQPRERRRTPRR